VRTINIKQKLEEMGVSPETVVMGDFDHIGEFTAKKERNPSDPNYRKYGAFFRPNYERGILVYHLIRQHNLTSMLEIGFGRGYATFCAARAFHDAGIAGKVTTVDPALDERFLGALQQVFPKDWFKHIQFMKGTSQAVVPTLNEAYDLIYIDGDHSYEGTKLDWELTKDKWNKHLLFDDYHLPSKGDPGIQCSKLIDEVNDPSKELIIMDRRMFFDDRRFTDDQIDYGQVLLTKPGISRDDW
jgi:hypothetical protein